MRIVAVLALLLSAEAALAEYLISDFGRILRYSDKGEFIDFYRGAILIEDLDLIIPSDPYQTTVLGSLALGPAGPDQRVYSIGNGSFGFFELGRFRAASGLGGNVATYIDPVAYSDGSDPPLPQFGYQGIVQRGISVDADGELWGFGRVRSWDFPNEPNYDVGWGLVKVAATPGAIPEVVFQVAPGCEEAFCSDPLFASPRLSIEFAPDGTAFVSTEYGMIEFDPNDVPELLSATIGAEPSIFFDPFDASDPISAFHADQPWMHPLLAGDMAGEWKYGADGLLRMVRTNDMGQVDLLTYDPSARLLSEPQELEVLFPGESLHRPFFRPDGALMLWVGTDESDRGDRLYRLVEVDTAAGLRVGEVFSRFMSSPNWAVLYVPTIPEPAGGLAALVGLLALAARPRR